MSLHNAKFVVTWTASGKRLTKVYDDYAQAQKALKWLNDKKVKDADLAVRLPRKQEELT